MLSENIKNLRKQKGYTQETLAQSLNIVRQTVSKWEKGYSVPDADMLENLSDVLEVPVSDLLGKPSEAPEQVSELERISSQLAILNEQMAREMARRKRNRKIGIIAGSIALFMIVAGIAVLFIAVPWNRQIPPCAVDNVEVVKYESEFYPDDDLDSAVEVIKQVFENDFDGCELTLLQYMGDDYCDTESEARGAQTVVFRSCFVTHKVSDESALNSDSTYTNWYWILERTDHGTWNHVDHGYL